jgi:hypothetical protein
VTPVLDAGALIAYEDGDPTVHAFLERASRTGVDVRTTTGAVAQVWRNGARQARLTLLLQGLLEVELTPANGLDASARCWAGQADATSSTVPSSTPL